MKRLSLFFAIYAGTALLGFWCYSAVFANGTPEIRRFAFGQVYKRKADVKNSLDLSYATRKRIVLEGGTYGGILAPQTTESLRDVLPEAQGADVDSNLVVWTYEFQPRRAKWVRGNSGDIWLYLIGRPSSDNSISITILPSSFEAPDGHILIQSEPNP